MKTEMSKSILRRKVKKVIVKINRTAMYWLNPKTQNLVCYGRARQLDLLNKKGVRRGIRNPDTNRLIAPQRAFSLGLIAIVK